jgi:hypothetical protein
MPCMDGTGPAGRGPGMGRGWGACAGSRRSAPRGRGRGLRTPLDRPAGDANQRSEKSVLEERVGFLERYLERLKSRLSSSAAEERGTS